MTITSVWFVRVVPKATIVQDEVEGASVVVCMLQEIFPEMRRELCGKFLEMSCELCGKIYDDFGQVFTLTMPSIHLFWQLKVCNKGFQRD